MATAEELLNSEEIAARTFSINSDLRTITAPANFTVFGVESDDDVARIYFKGPRFYKGVDLSTFRVRVNILNGNKEEDAYDVTDMQVDPSTDTIIFSWLIGRHTAQYSGEIRFALCFRELDENAYVLREFNTTIATGTILEGLETTTLIMQKYPDLIDDIYLRLENLEENGLPLWSVDTELKVPGKPADAKAVGDAIADIAVAKQLEVTLDPVTSTASHSSTEIIEYRNRGGHAILKTYSGGYVSLSGITSNIAIFNGVAVYRDRAVQYSYTVLPDKTYNLMETELDLSGIGMTEEQAEQLQTNTEAIADLTKPVESIAMTVENQKYTIVLTMEGGSKEEHILETDENDYPKKLTVNGRDITITVTEV